MAVYWISEQRLFKPAGGDDGDDDADGDGGGGGDDVRRSYGQWMEAMVVNGRRWSTMLTIRRAVGRIFGAFDDR